MITDVRTGLIIGTTNRGYITWVCKHGERWGKIVFIPFRPLSGEFECKCDERKLTPEKIK